jgi:hypothetical protein
MSLINDALKRAGKTRDPRRAVRHPAPHPALQPVEGSPSGAVAPPWLIPVLLSLVLAMAGFFLLSWWKTRPPTSMASAALQPPVPERVPASPAFAPVRGAAPPVQAIQAPAPIIPAVGGRNQGRSSIKINTNLVVRTNLPSRTSTIPGATNDGAAETASTPSPPAAPAVVDVPGPAAPAVTNAATPGVVPAPAVVSKPTFPTVKVQGIFYREDNPSALINGRTVYVGDRLEDMRVTKIEKNSVTLEWEGQSKVISLY